ncbi:hypothetical protein MVEN_00630200 [Mycena venus]|uniref:Uncharacterized protein n=1 Tax=Mycena venus TaxID=2733690 RepID=A0A8H6YPH9_9AGAR|nr:hypothetical protein MVEN_00630200 [Mycena venus]
MVYHWPWAKFYNHAWELASITATVVALYAQYQLMSTADASGILLGLTTFLTPVRIVHCGFVVLTALVKRWFLPLVYLVGLTYFAFWSIFATTFCMMNRFIFSNDRKLLLPASFMVCVATHDVLFLLEFCCGNILLRYRATWTVDAWVEDHLARDSITDRKQNRFQGKNILFLVATA